MMRKLRYSRLLFGRFVLFLSAIGWVPAATADALAGQRPSCPSKCGDVDIPFPFGIGEQCAMQTDFQFDLECLPVDSTPKRPFFKDVEVTKISVEDGKAWMKLDISTQCYDQQTGNMTYNTWNFDFDGSPFWLSADNKIIIIGCETLAYMQSNSLRVAPSVWWCRAGPGVRRGAAQGGAERGVWGGAGQRRPAEL
ncbi:hypothetical protein ABZP36_035395 [Zizania latifolia]